MSLRRLFPTVLLASSVFTAGCLGRGAAARRKIPSGIVLDLAGAPAEDPALAPQLTGIGVSSFFVGACDAKAAGPSATFSPVAAPPSAYTLPVYLEVSGRGDFGAYFDAEKEGAADRIWSCLAPAVRASSSYGQVAGVHLALPVGRSPESYARALRALRRRVPAGLTLSVAIFGPPRTSDERDGWKRVARTVDFAVAEAFGRAPDADPAGRKVSADPAELVDLGLPMMAGFFPQGWGTVRSTGQRVPDGAINELSEDRGVTFSFGDLFSDPDETTYVFTGNRDATGAAGGLLPAGDSVTFRERSISDFLKAFSAARASRARVVSLDGLSSSPSLFTFAVLQDALAGRPLHPDLSFTRNDSPGAVSFVAVNTAAEWSGLSRMNNWIDLRVEGGSIRSVSNGDFDRYQYLDAQGNLVSSERASKIRFFENFIAPGESMETGPITYAGDPKFFASAHVSLSDGSTVDIPESEVAPAPAEGAPAPSASGEGANGSGHPPGRKR